MDLEQPGRLGITVLPQSTVVFAPSNATVISGCVDYTACVSTPVQVSTDPPLGPGQVATLLLDSSSVGGLLLSLEAPDLDRLARERTTQVTVELTELTTVKAVYLYADRDAQPVSGVVEVTVEDEKIETKTGLDIVAGPGLPVEVRRPRFELFFALTEDGDGIVETVITANTTQQFVVAVRSLDGVGLPEPPEAATVDVTAAPGSGVFLVTPDQVHSLGAERAFSQLELFVASTAVRGERPRGGFGRARRCIECTVCLGDFVGENRRAAIRGQLRARTCVATRRQLRKHHRGRGEDPAYFAGGTSVCPG